MLFWLADQGRLGRKSGSGFYAYDDAGQLLDLFNQKPDGSVLCNDNRRGTRDPMIRSDFPIGTAQVWVGVKEEGARASYRLGFSEVKWKSSSIPLPESD